MIKYLLTGKIKSWNGFLELEYTIDYGELIPRQEVAVAERSILEKNIINTLDKLTYNCGPNGQVASEILNQFNLTSISIIDTLSGAGVIVTKEDNK